MPLILNEDDLRILGLDKSTLENLNSVEKQQQEIKQAWRRLIFLHHPDKGGSKDDFRTINEAYTRLTRKQANLSSSYDIYNYFIQPEIDIPDDAFDIMMQDGIMQSFERLRKDFSTLNEREKQNFATYYAPFLTLVKKLEQRQNELTRISAEELHYLQHKETLGKFILREWRILVIRLFAEEYLNDFQYRDALATGNFRPILATSKLLNPIKGLAFVIASLNLFFSWTAEYALKYNSSMSVIIYTINAPINTINLIAELIANPVNRIIKPLAQLTKIPPFVYTALLTAISAAVTYGLIIGFFTLSLATLELTLPILTLALNLYSIYPAYKAVKNLMNLGDNNSAIQLAFALGIGIVLNMIPSGVTLVDFVFSIGQLCAIQAIKKSTEAKSVEYLPSPTTPVSEKVKAATLLGYTKASQSHRFFGTPKDADVDNNRTPWQKFGSFWGVDLVRKPKEPLLKHDEPKLTPSFNV